MVRIFVLTDIRLYREGLTILFAHQEGMAVIGSSAAEEVSIPALRELAPDVVLLDMAVLDSVATLRMLVEAFHGVPVIALAVPDADGHVVACAEGGVAGYLPRDGSIADLLATIRSAGRGELRCSPRLAGALARRVAILSSEHPPNADTERAAELTGREREVVDLIDEGFSNKEIARRLCIEVATVKNHVHNILEKLHVSRRAEAAARVRRHREMGSAALAHRLRT